MIRVAQLFVFPVPFAWAVARTLVPLDAAVFVRCGICCAWAAFCVAGVALLGGRLALLVVFVCVCALAFSFAGVFVVVICVVCLLVARKLRLRRIRDCCAIALAFVSLAFQLPRHCQGTCAGTQGAAPAELERAMDRIYQPRRRCPVMILP